MAMASLMLVVANDSWLGSACKRSVTCAGRGLPAYIFWMVSYRWEAESAAFHSGNPTDAIVCWRVRPTPDLPCLKGWCYSSTVKRGPV
jgi:hypothetical protein